VRKRVAVGDPVTYTYGPQRVVHARVASLERGEDGVAWFRTSPWDASTPVAQIEDYEGVTWERGLTDGVALLAAHALAASRE